jgi:hypothetical protein
MVCLPVYLFWGTGTHLQHGKQMQMPFVIVAHFPYSGFFSQKGKQGKQGKQNKYNTLNINHLQLVYQN